MMEMIKVDLVHRKFLIVSYRNCSCQVMLAAHRFRFGVVLDATFKLFSISFLVSPALEVAAHFVQYNLILLLNFSELQNFLPELVLIMCTF
jgi:hypothetical protein